MEKRKRGLPFEFSRSKLHRVRRVSFSTDGSQPSALFSKVHHTVAASLCCRNGGWSGRKLDNGGKKSNESADTRILDIGSLLDADGSDFFRRSGQKRSRFRERERTVFQRTSRTIGCGLQPPCLLKKVNGWGLHD